MSCSAQFPLFCVKTFAASVADTVLVVTSSCNRNTFESIVLLVSRLFPPGTIDSETVCHLRGSRSILNQKLSCNNRQWSQTERQRRSIICLSGNSSLYFFPFPLGTYTVLWSFVCATHAVHGCFHFTFVCIICYTTIRVHKSYKRRDHEQAVIMVQTHFLFRCFVCMNVL